MGVSLLHEVLEKTAVVGGALIIGGAVYFTYKTEEPAASEKRAGQRLQVYEDSCLRWGKPLERGAWEVYRPLKRRVKQW